MKNRDEMMSFLIRCQESYHKGKPIITDDEFDNLAERYDYYQVGYQPILGKKHYSQMFSLRKVFEEDGIEIMDGRIDDTPKLDGSAISLLYKDGHLIQALTRGNGIEGEDITDKLLASPMVPNRVPHFSTVQICGEVVAEKTIKNARNYSAGALHLKDIDEFLSRELTFIAYDMKPFLSKYYGEDMNVLKYWGFNIVTESDWKQFPQDGRVIRLSSNASYELEGYTSKHPKGAYALKKRSDVISIPTTLREVVWQIGKGGKVTPVALFDGIVIEDANITRATLHNVGFIEEHDLALGDTILITRAGGIIPKVVGKVDA